jgi:hypothetical protein
MTGKPLGETTIMRLRILTAAIATACFFAGSAYAVSPTYGPSAPDTRSDKALPGSYQEKASKKKHGIEPLRGPWRVTKSLKNKGKEPVDENGNVYACMDQACKVSRKVDEKRD